MNPILFYGVPEGCSFGSIVALEWSGMPYRLCRIEMPDVVSGPEFSRINPLGKTPALMAATGETLSESMAILNHIGAIAAESGIGFAQGTSEFDRLNERLAFLNTGFFNAFSPLWHVVEHELGGTANKVLTAYGKAEVARAHGELAALIGDGEWLCGEARTVADAYFFGIARWADFHRAADRRDYPAVDRLWRRLEDDPAVRFALAVEHGEPATSSGAFAGEVGLDEVLEWLPPAA